MNTNRLIFPSPSCFPLKHQYPRCNFHSWMSEKKESLRKISGQASIEYLLTLVAIFLAMAGVPVLFSSQVDRFLSLLFELIQPPY